MSLLSSENFESHLSSANCIQLCYGASCEPNHGAGERKSMPFRVIRIPNRYPIQSGTPPYRKVIPLDLLKSSCTF